MKARFWAVTLSALFGVVLAWYLVYTQQLVSALRSDAAAVSSMYARIFQGLADPSQQSGVTALFDLLRQIEQLGIPVVVIDPSGEPSAAANLPFQFSLSDPDDAERVLEYAAVLDRRNAPIIQPGIGEIHFGAPSVVERLRWVPWTQAAALIVIVLAAVWIVRSTVSAERERMWATMAREAAHQLGTPLSSLTGWVEILRMRPSTRSEIASDEMIAKEVEVDIERLNKVAQRFELIGQQPDLQRVKVEDILRRLEEYFQARLPRMDRSIELDIQTEPGLARVEGNPVLLEWAFENIIKNAIDVLAGRGGRIAVTAESMRGRVRICFRDDGPGVPAELRDHLFEPGVSGKEGWGIGLTLTRRIIRVTHGGSIILGAPEKGALFVVELPIAASDENSGAQQ